MHEYLDMTSELSEPLEHPRLYAEGICTKVQKKMRWILECIMVSEADNSNVFYGVDAVGR